MAGAAGRHRTPHCHVGRVPQGTDGARTGFRLLSHWGLSLAPRQCDLDPALCLQWATNEERLVNKPRQSIQIY